MKPLLLFAGSLLGWMLSPAACAAGLPPDAQMRAAQITRVVSDFVQRQTATQPGKVTFQVGGLDPRVALPACASPEAFLPVGSRLIGKAMVGIRCPGRAGRNGRDIFIPVQIWVSRNLLVSARQLPLGHALQSEDLTSQTIEASQMEGFSDPQQAIGKILRYGISAGQVLREDMLRPPYSVTQGQMVQLVVQGQGFSVRSGGSALNNAIEGQAVQVRSESGRVVGGLARDTGIVGVGP